MTILEGVEMLDETFHTKHFIQIIRDIIKWINLQFT